MSDITIDVVKVKSKDAKKNTQQTDSASNKVVVSPEEIRKKKESNATNKNTIPYLLNCKPIIRKCSLKKLKSHAIGIDLELKQILNGQFPHNQLNRLFHKYCGSLKYKEKRVEGARRLDGSPAALVTEKK